MDTHTPVYGGFVQYFSSICSQYFNITNKLCGKDKQVKLEYRVAAIYTKWNAIVLALFGYFILLIYRRQMKPEETED